MSLRTILITGTTSGLGEFITLNLLKKGHKILGLSRSDLSDKSPLKHYDNVLYFHKKCDLSDQEQIMNIENLFSIEALGSLSAIISNAGIHGPIGNLKDADTDEFIKSLNVNLVAPFLIAKKLLPVMCSNYLNRPKFIQLSGGGATKPMYFALGYAASKTAVVRLMNSIAVEYKDICDINSLAPGVLNTKLLDEVIDAGTEKVGAEYFNNIKKQKDDGATDMGKAYKLIEFLLSSDSDGLTGKLISAVWDDYQSWVPDIDEITDSDIYTLTRKV
tara:strand:- start:3692 stop:4513 length:822 start_codon:yes stop_codon:yes gene_type:complete